MQASTPAASKCARANFDAAGVDPGIHRLGRPRDDFAGHRDDRLGTKPIEDRMRRAVRVGHDLGNAIMVAQIDEHQIAVVALAVDPA